MSGPVDSSATKSRSPKREARRALVREAAARRAAAQRRKRLAVGVVATVAAIGLVAAVVYFWGHSKPAHKAAPQASASVNPALATKPTVTAGSGELTKLNVTTLVQGTGSPVALDQTVSVNYVGVSYKTGVEFDSSWKEGSKPFSFAVGQGKVIKGWDQGLVGVKVGSRVQLDIPSDLAYGDNPSGGRPAGPLRFVVDVLSVS
jgi:peptidylprolyl isomerase